MGVVCCTPPSNGINLRRKWFVEPLLSELCWWFFQPREVLGAEFDGTRFKSIRPVRVDANFGQWRVDVGVHQPTKRVDEADSFDRGLLSLGGGVHGQADQVVYQREHGEFLEYATPRSGNAQRPSPSWF